MYPRKHWALPGSSKSRYSVRVSVWGAWTFLRKSETNLLLLYLCVGGVSVTVKLLTDAILRHHHIQLPNLFPFQTVARNNIKYYIVLINMKVFIAKHDLSNAPISN